MSTAISILFGRDDLSIPGAADVSPPQDPAAVRSRFFSLLRQAEPDVIVLDFSAMPVKGVETILQIRQLSSIPVLIVCQPHPETIEEYRIAGAAGCVPAPIDLLVLNRAIQRILEVTRRAPTGPGRNGAALEFAGIRFYEPRNLLTDADGSSCELTAMESRVLAYFLAKPWELCTRGELGAALHGEPGAVGERAIDVVINRLRKKLVLMAGCEAEHLIKTEFRRGYTLVTDVAAAADHAAGALGVAR